MDILNKFGIDPYNYLGVSVDDTSDTVKKIYKTKAKVLHPDKTGGKTEAQFKLLVLSYRYCLKNCVDTPVATHSELKSAERPEVAYSKNFYETDFENKDTRNHLFVDDDIDLEKFEEYVKQCETKSTTYSAENFYKKEVLDTMKTNGKFDKEKFNAFFNKLQKDGKIPNQLTLKEEVVPANLNKEYVNVNVHGDMMINSIDKRKNLINQPTVSSYDITKLIDTDIKVIEKLIKDHKKDTGKISRKKLRELQDLAKKDVKIQSNGTHSQNIEKMIYEQRLELLNAKKKQEDFVQKNKRVFVSSIAY
jgi:hypothetical protein